MKRFCFRSLILPALFAAGFFFFGQSARAADIIIDQDTVWDTAEPIIVNGQYGIQVMPGATLTIEAGVVVKFAPNNALVVGGNLEVKGEAGRPVIFTSLRDDKAGGDTNGDGTFSAPAPGDWYGLVVSGPADQLRNERVRISGAIIRYGGFLNGNKAGVISVFACQEFTVERSAIINNEGVIMNASANFKINHSNIYNPDYCQDFEEIHYCGTTFINQGEQAPDLTNNYWGHEAGPTVAPPDVKGTFIMGLAEFEPFLTAPVTVEPAPRLDPVIIIPGILGSWSVGGQWRIDPIRHTYDNLIEALVQAGYHLTGADQNLFLFPYDWRQDNSVTALALEQKINEVKEQTSSNWVDLVAHSMGGLVARSYIESGNYHNDVDQMIFVGTPHLGSPSAYPTYEAGEFAGESSAFYRRLFNTYALAHGYFDLTKYIREKVVTVGQLLPIYNYLKAQDASGDWVLRPYYENYPRNIFLEYLNLPANVDLLKQRTNVVNIVSGVGVNNASTVEFIKIVADPNLNDNKWLHGYPENFNQDRNWAFENGRGDGTVPYTSANSLTGVATVEIAAGNHDALPTLAQQDIIEQLTGHYPTDYYDSSDLYAVKRWLITAVFSPADLQIIAPNGQRAGQDFVSGENLQEIAGAFYSGPDKAEPELIAIPNPLAGDYQIKLQGTDNGGAYKLWVATVDEDQPAGSQDFFLESVIAAKSQDEFVFSYDEQNSQDLSLTPQISYAKLLKLIQQLYNNKELKPAVYAYLKENFKFFEAKTKEIAKLKNKTVKKIAQKAVEVRWQLMLRELSLYVRKGWISAQAHAVLQANLKLLINNH